MCLECVDRSIRSGNGQARSAFHSHPILMGQYGTGGKEIFNGRFSRSVQGSEMLVCFNAGLVDRVTRRIEKAILCLLYTSDAADDLYTV